MDLLNQKIARQIAFYVGLAASILQLVIDFGLPEPWKSRAIAATGLLAMLGVKFPGTYDKVDLDKLADAEAKKLASLRPPSLYPSLQPTTAVPSVTTQPMATIVDSEDKKSPGA